MGADPISDCAIANTTNTIELAVNGHFEGVFHTHDRRECWDCGGVGIVHRSISLRLTERTLVMIGWRYLEPEGRMVCAECAEARRYDHSSPAP